MLCFLQLLKEDLEKLLREWQKVYTSQDVNIVAQQHNEWREGVLREAVEVQLLPGIRAEARRQLLSQAREYALQTCSHNLWGMATRGPLQVTFVCTAHDLGYLLRCSADVRARHRSFLFEEIVAG